MLSKIFEQNKNWAKKIKESDPDFFLNLSKEQHPQYLWIGCSDSRVPANEILGLAPGDVFVHRNVANVVEPHDLNCLTVIQFAVEVLKVRHIIVCGHYGCGGIKTVMEDRDHGMMDNWLHTVKDLFIKYHLKLNEIRDAEKRINVLSELNVIEQVKNVCQTDFVQQAWKKHQKLTVHGLVYGLSDGILKDLNVSTSNNKEAQNICNTQTS